MLLNDLENEVKYMDHKTEKEVQFIKKAFRILAEQERLNESSSDSGNEANGNETSLYKKEDLN